ncbi:hypothetical protein DRQ36_03160, partial [bacterium]
MKYTISIVLLLCAASVVAEDTIPPYIEILWPDTGAYISCSNVIIEVLIVDREFFVDPASILLSVYSSIGGWMHAIDEFVFSFTDSFYYFPIHRPMFDNDSLWCLMSPICDYDSNYSESFEWFFYTDYSGPEITDLTPAPGSFISDPHASISATVFDPAGLTHDSCFIEIHGDT